MSELEVLKEAKETIGFMFGKSTLEKGQWSFFKKLNNSKTAQVTKHINGQAKVRIN